MASTPATNAATDGAREVELHSHDFEWEELARACEAEQGGAEGALGDDSDGDAEGLADEAKSSWDAFHARNKGRVYKPRNYLVKEFPELVNMEQDEITVLELGCGYGSAIFPILTASPKVRAHVCDFSAHAIAMLQQNPLFDARRCRAFVCDVAREELHGVAPGSIDVALLVFAMSALPPASFLETLRKVREALRPGGLLCFRDYGLYDLAMRRSAKRRLGKALFYRSDGTLAYFFSRDDVERVFGRQAGFLVLENEYATVRLTNRKTRISMDRVWLHAKLQKPAADDAVEGLTQ